jgi:glutamate-1-semialdehyde 2,1-aminomutase
LTEKALRNTFKVYAKAVEKGYEQYLDGNVIKPVFRKYN